MGTEIERNYKFRLTEKKDEDGLYRIQALRDLPLHGVKEGGMGGWIEHEDCLSDEGECWVADEARILERAVVSGDAIVKDMATVSGRARAGERAKVTGSSCVRGNAFVMGSALLQEYAMIDDDSVIDENAVISGWARALGRSRVAGRAEVYGHAIAKDSAIITGSSHVCGYAIIHGNAIIENAWVEDDARVTGDARVTSGVWGRGLCVGGNAKVGSPFDVIQISSLTENALPLTLWKEETGAHGSIGGYMGPVAGMLEWAREKFPEDRRALAELELAAKVAEMRWALWS